MGVSTASNRVMDCRYRDSGLLIWLVSRMKPGTVCWAWSFWRCAWEKVRVIEADSYLKMHDVMYFDYPKMHYPVAWFRIRPWWWFWAKWTLVLAVAVLLGVVGWLPYVLTAVCVALTILLSLCVGVLIYLASRALK